MNETEEEQEETLRSSIELESLSPISPNVSSSGAAGIKRRCLKSTRRRSVVVCVLTAVLAALVGFLIGFYVPGPGLLKSKYCSNVPSKNEEFHDSFQDLVKAEELEDNLRFYSAEPHFGGSNRSLQLANHIADKWREYGFDEVEMPEYKVLLSVPQEDKPNVIEVVNNGVVEHTIVGKINVSAGTGSKDSFQYFPFIANSPQGVAEGELVYCHYGSENDLQELDRRGISVKGKVVLLRSISSRLAAVSKRGAVGALLYPDPEEADSQNTYPNGPWASKDAVFSKAIFAQYGDPLTPQLPAIPGMYRKPRSQIDLPQILVQPISYEDAFYLLSRLRGPEVPVSWRGDLKVTYRFGPGFLSSNTTVRLRVNNQLVLKSIYNVIGTIHGREEPDRYVLVGNHRDAESFGAADASSGTATIMEIARVFGKIKENGWRPQRTVKLCSWGAEEAGLIGSLEWVQQNFKLLSNRAVVYLNTDVAVGGNYVMIAQTCPMLKNAIFCRAKKVKDPNGNGDIYDVMAKRYRSWNDEPRTLPFYYPSDYLTFYMSVGIPSADFSFFFGSDDQWELYPVYHTQEDNFYWIKTFVDPNFQFHLAMAKFVGGLALDFADSPLLPFDVSRYARAVKWAFNGLELRVNNFNSTISTAFIRRAIEKFVNASSTFQTAKENLTGKEKGLILRSFNDQMVQVEKAFINPLVLGKDQSFKHVFGRENYTTFPGVLMALDNAQQTGNIDEVEKQLSLVAEAIMSAAEIIKPVVCKRSN